MTAPALPPVALVNMPFAPARGPSIQLGILRALARGRGFPVQEHYFNLAFLDLLRRHGMDAAYDATLPGLVAEWLFSEGADAGAPLREPSSDPADPAHTLQEFARAAGTTPDVLVDVKTRLVPAFLDECARAAGLAGAAAACFTLTFPQVCASLALARRLKDAYPRLVIVMGGAASQVHAMSARELMRLHPFLDVMVHGEAEPVFGDLLERLVRSRPLRGLPGVVCRTPRGVSRAVPPAVQDNVNGCPVPDYAGFLAARNALPAPTRALVGADVPIEFGRGCVWGQHQPCTFCGFYPLGGFREKSPTRVVDEVAQLRHQTGSSALTVMDAAVTSALVRRVFPLLKATQPGLNIRFLQLRTQVTRSQVELLSAAGVRLVQPGIECLESSHACWRALPRARTCLTTSCS